MRTVCAVDASGLAALLSALTWVPDSNWRGAFNMIAWSHMPEEMRREVEAVAGQVLVHLPGRKRGTTYLARRVPGEQVAPHTDREDGACPLRIHVPIVTQPEALFLSEGRWGHMEEGKAWAIDPTKEHAIRVEGQGDRIHLWFNAVPE